MAVEEQGSCIRLNQSDPFKIGNNYGGIPVNLVTNLICWAILIILFFIIRKSTIRNVGRKVAKTTIDGVDAVNTWTHIFFAGENTPAAVKKNLEEQLDDLEGKTAFIASSFSAEADEEPANSTVYGSIQDNGENGCVVRESADGPDSGGGGAADGATSEGNNGLVVSAAAAAEGARFSGGSASKLSRQQSVDKRIRSLKRGAKIYRVREKSLEVLMGPDAVQYLRFQKYIIIYILVTTIVSLGIVLPVNFQGTLQGNATDFGHTTMANVDPKNEVQVNYLWVHIILAFLLFPLSIFLMRRFSIGLRMRDTSLGATRTIAIENIPMQFCTRESVKAHFDEAYPKFQIKDIQLAYNVDRLTVLSRELRDVIDAKKYAEAHNARNKEELDMVPARCARCCFCFCLPCTGRVTCVEYYQEQEQLLQEKIRLQKEIALKTKLGMAFVTFESINQARRVLRDHKFSLLAFRHSPPVSSVDIKPSKWKVWYAPEPADIIWENLSDRREWLLIKKILANLFVFLIAFFLTTPQLIVHHLDPILNILQNLTRPSELPLNSTAPAHPFSDLPSLLTDFLPTLMIWTFTALLPVLVAYSDRLLGHWTRSGENHAIMKKTFWYLISMVIILPTFGFTSGQATIEFLFRNFNSTDLDSDTARWDCIFLPDSGAFFVNYVITAAMIGSGLELIRFPELFWYLIQICCSSSKADTPAIRRAITVEFRFGEQYARMMLLFAMVVMYSIPCPLITPFGCLYFILKHLVDRHNLAFVYAPSKINKKIHATAIHFVIMSVALLQLLMVIFSFIRSGNIKSGIITPQTKVAIGLFVLTLNVCSAQIWSATCKKISPIKYEDIILVEDGEDESEVYLPEVLRTDLDTL